MEIAGDDPATAEALRALWRTVQANGGAARREMRLVAEGGALSVAAPVSVPPDATLVEIPDICLPPAAAARFAVAADGRLALTGLDPTLPAGTADCVRGLLDVYNAGGQLAAHRRASPWFALAGDRALLDHLAAGRWGTAKVRDKAGQLDAGDTDALAVADFLGTRTFTRSQGPRAGRGVPVLMPILDAFNHHPAAEGIGLVPDDGALFAGKAHPVEGSEECFVRYARMDALDAYLTYAFAATRTPWLFSVTCELTPKRGPKLVVRGEGGGHYTGALPTELERWRAWVPRVHHADRRRVVVSRLPLRVAEAPRLLPRLVAFLIQHAEPRLADKRLLRRTRDLVDRALQVNGDYRERLTALREDAAATPPEAAPPGREAALRTVQDLEQHIAALLDAAWTRDRL